MNSLAFIGAAAVFVGLTVFVFFNYPQSWRKNKMFIAVLILWHIFGLAATVTVFTVYRDIPYEGIRYEITRQASAYYILTMLLAILFGVRFVCVKIYYFVNRLLKREVREKRKHFIEDKRFHAILFIVISALIFEAGYFNIDFLKGTRYDISIPKKTQEQELTICLIADIHAGSGTFEYTYDDLADRIDEAEADVLLIAGDVYDETTCGKDQELVEWVIDTIKMPRYGIYYIYGNHDNSVDDWAAQQMRAMGVTVLEDEMTTIGEDIQLIGTLDPKAGARPVDQVLAELSPDTDKPVLVLTHRPKHFQKMADAGCDLAMAGHTHGFNIPQFLGSAMFEDMYYGIKKYDNMTAITTSGVAAWGFHYKWPAKSEVVTIHLTFEQ